MSRPTVRLIDVLTGDVVDRPMTDEELEQQKIDEAQNEAIEADFANKQAIKNSGRAKLKALGLTDDEIAALLP